MKATIITVGDEILIGQITDTNSAWLGQELSDIGVSVQKIISVADRHEEIIMGMEQGLASADIIFMTGGLGPTKDDITKKAIAEFLGVDMFFHQETHEKIKRMFERLGRQVSPLHVEQSLMPIGVEILHNRMGTAPGMLFHHQGKMIISMPGVPFEMKSIMQEVVLPILKQKHSTQTIIHKTILTSGEGETYIENKISHIIAKFPDHLKIAYLPGLGQVRLRLSAIGVEKSILESDIVLFTKEIVNEISTIVFGFDDSSLEKEIANVCIKKGIKIGTAESCTGGYIASRLVSISGASTYFVGGIIAYSNDVKINLLNVNEQTLIDCGAVSESTVIEMVNGAIETLKLDVAVAISGIAGPDGGTSEKPVGTIWICVGDSVKKFNPID
ncbi:MAG: CinA family nicotinamide mononucleotide deamidase-related protein [Saprospiraceae bacterium]|nr:CinA family nicotinamide mononucleotide deamidase-related protein [Saprospiraceae bacterium]